jgi:hypothetical protein
MKKAVLALAAMSLVAGACGGSGDDEVATETTAATTTMAPTTTTTEAAAAANEGEVESFVPSGDPELDAVATAFLVAFDSTTDYEAKLPYVDDLSGLEDTVNRYMEQGESMGGVTVAVKDVVINGDSAEVTYDLMFNGRPTYPDLSSAAVLTADGWKVPRDSFCGMMASARVPCSSG